MPAPIDIRKVPADQLRDALKSLLITLKNERPEAFSIVLFMATSDQDQMQWWKITASIQTLYTLADIGLVESKDSYNYSLFNKALVKDVLQELGFIKWRPGEKGPTFPVSEDMFSAVVGYDRVKKIIMMALRSRKPTHVLLVGPPGIGKSLFLDSVRNYMEKRNVCVKHVEAVRGLTTSVGIADLLLEIDRDTPCILLIDELDKLSGDDLFVLLRIMEPRFEDGAGELIITKHGKRIYEKRKIWVLAAANDITKIPDMLRDRFMVIRFRGLTKDEFLKVVPQVLVVNEGVNPDLAKYIAERVSQVTLDIREAIRIARMAYSKEDVDFLIESLKKGQSGVSPED